jgi:L-ribulose-5-phosphate 3-epimerase
MAERNLPYSIANGWTSPTTSAATLSAPIAAAPKRLPYPLPTRGPPPAIDKAEALKWAADSYHPLLEYARPAGIKILIENHGGVSNDPDWMVDLMKKINDPIFGTYPDWREPSPEFDNLNYLKKTLPYAKGMSYRNQPDDELSMQMIELCRQGRFHGWYGIESDGRDQIKKAIRLLKAHLPGTSLP